jgi:uncharacterized protein YndB with AHSA1/START domain
VENLAIERSVWIAAPRERVWRAITEPEQLVQWFLPAMPGVQINRDADGKLALNMGFMVADFAMLDSMTPPHQMTTRSLPDLLLATTYTLEEDNNGTKVTVTMTGFEALPEGEREDRFHLSGAAWDDALANLKAHIAGEPLPFPYASVAPLFGYFREMKDKLAVERTIWIAAPRERVWEALTDPAQIAQWFSPGSTFKATGTEVGSRLYIEDPETGGEMYTQVIDLYDAPYRLVTRSTPEPPETPTVTSYRLDEEKNGTRLTLTYSGYELKPAETRGQNMEENAFGFGMMLANVKAFIEGTPMPMPGGF